MSPTYSLFQAYVSSGLLFMMFVTEGAPCRWGEFPICLQAHPRSQLATFHTQIWLLFPGWVCEARSIYTQANKIFPVQGNEEFDFTL